MDELFTIGKIVSYHGLKGEVKSFIYTNDASRFMNLKTVYIDGDEYEIKTSYSLNKFIVIKFKSIDSIDEAQKIINKDIKIYKSQRPELSDDEFYISDLISYKCYDEEGIYIGELTDILSYSANDCFVVLRDGKEYYVPAVKKFIKSIDKNNKEIIINVIEGLF